MSETMVNEDNPYGILTPKEVATRLRISVRKLWKLVKTEEIKRPVRIGERGTRWFEEDIEKYLEDKDARRGETAMAR